MLCFVLEQRSDAHLKRAKSIQPTYTGPSKQSSHCPVCTADGGTGGRNAEVTVQSTLYDYYFWLACLKASLPAPVV